MSKIVKVEISFPVAVDLPAGWERALDGLVDMVCGKYEEEHPDRVMWPAGHGSRVLWREPEEPDFDDSVFEISVSEREAYPKELERRAWQKMTSEERKAATAADRRAVTPSGDSR